MITHELRSGCAPVKAARILTGLALIFSTMAHGQKVERAPTPPPGLNRLPMSVTGRVDRGPDGSLLRQWPGTYFETAFTGTLAYFRVGPGEVSLRASVDNRVPVPLVKPAPGTYLVSGLASGRHRLRIDVASESQAERTSFGGFFAPAGTEPAPITHKTRAIEFIGDSQTVGYGNTSTTRQCTEDQVWATTDTSRGLAPVVARHYNADYQVNAISGRGIVRNYNGFNAATLPQAYPYATLDSTKLAGKTAWHPHLVIIALGANDFSTPLNAGEKWASRAALHADFEATYIRFVDQLRSRYPRAYFMLWATDQANGEIRQEVVSVVDQLRQSGFGRVGFVAVENLSFSACNSHPSIADDRKIARALIGFADNEPTVWLSGGAHPGTTLSARRLRQERAAGVTLVHPSGDWSAGKISSSPKRTER